MEIHHGFFFVRISADADDGPLFGRHIELDAGFGEPFDTLCGDLFGIEEDVDVFLFDEGEGDGVDLGGTIPRVGHIRVGHMSSFG